jgi:hypothetical protein
MSKEAKQFLMAVFSSLVANAIFEGVIKGLSTATFPSWTVHVYIFAVSFVVYYLGLYVGKREKHLTPRELEIKADFEQLNCAEQAVTRFVLKRGTVHVAQVWSFMDQQCLKGKPVESVRARTGFILGTEELAINPEFKPYLEKIVG